MGNLNNHISNSSLTGGIAATTGAYTSSTSSWYDPYANTYRSTLQPEYMVIGNILIDGKNGTIKFTNPDGEISTLNLNDSSKLKRIIDELRVYWPEVITDFVLKGLI